MKTKAGKIIAAISASLALFSAAASASALADYNVYVNGQRDTMELEKGSTYAIGGSGAGAIDEEDVYVLTSNGLEKLGSSGSVSDKPSHGQDDFEGGGGLLYDDETVEIISDKVFVGLNYYYSPARDTGLGAANLENAIGHGYEFGYFDEEREFVAVDYTDETKITMRIVAGTGIGVYITGTERLLYEVPITNSENMLAVRPLCEETDAVTWFSGHKYYGDFAYAVLGGGKITVINAVDIEKYVMGVCSREMSSSWPLEALKAQAVAARTYAAKKIKSSIYYQTCGFDVTGDTYSQAYSGCDAVGARIERAVDETENEYLTWDEGLCDAQYFSSDGGGTEDNRNVYGNSAHPYLVGVIDPYESAVDSINNYSEWSRTMTSSELGERVGLPDVDWVDAEYSETGNVIKLTLTSSSGREAVISRSYCRTTLGLPSIRYSVEKNRGDFVFSGSGWGHNVGMSQFGAYAMAEYYDKTYKDILGFYYSGVGLSYGRVY